MTAPDDGSPLDRGGPGGTDGGGAAEGGGAPERRSGGLVEEGAPLWTVTFGDMMSLLLTFFILLFSMSELKMEKFLLASQSLRQVMGGTAEETIEDPMGLMPDPVDPDLQLQNPGMTDGASPMAGDGPLTGEGTAEGAEPADGTAHGSASVDWMDRVADAYLDAIAKRLQAFVEERGLEETLHVDRAAEGVYLRIQTAALFASGRATIQPDGQWLLDDLGDLARDMGLRVVVSGHADDRPIATAAFPSNWELSAARAAGVARAIVDGGHRPDQVRVESYGSFRPVASNETAEGRARNRRVELFYARADVMAAALQAVAAEGAGGAAAAPASSADTAVAPEAEADGAAAPEASADTAVAPEAEAPAR